MRWLIVLASAVFIPVFASTSCGSYIRDGKNHRIPCDYAQQSAPKRACHAEITLVGKKHVFKQVCAQHNRALRVVEPSGAFKARLIEHRSEINALSAEYDIDPALIHAIIAVESVYHADAVSEKGAMGLMQLMPATIKAHKLNDPFAPKENIRGGIAQIKALLERYKGDVSLALAAYNAGVGALSQYQNTIPPFPETQGYVNAVRTYRQRFTSDWQHHIQDDNNP